MAGRVGHDHGQGRSLICRHTSPIPRRVEKFCILRVPLKLLYQVRHLGLRDIDVL